MRTKVFFLGSILVLLCLAVCSVQADDTTPASNAIRTLPALMDFKRPSERPALAVCSLKNNDGTALAYNSDIELGDRFASFMNPINCSGVDDYPMAVYWVSFPLYAYSGAKWPVGVNVQFWSAGTDSCQGPKELLYTYHVLCDSNKFAAPKIGVVTLPNPVCVEGPFFVSVEYDGTTPSPYPSILFDTQVPANPCMNWAFRKVWNPWDVFFIAPGAGNFMVWIDGYSNSGFCATEDSVVRTIESLHADWPALEASRVTVAGYYTDSADGKLVSNYDAFLANSPMPPKSELLLLGPRPDTAYQGDLVRMSGYFHATRDPHPTSPADTVTLSLLPYRWVTILDAPLYPQSSENVSAPVEDAFAPQSGCDSCKYAIYLGGGINRANDHARYWNELVEAYGTKNYWGGVCDNEAYVLYSSGLDKTPSIIPQSRTDSLTAANVSKSFDDVSKRVAKCFRTYGRATVIVEVAGQADLNGLLMLGGSPLPLATFRSYMQKLLDSGATSIDLTVSGSYGGNLCDSLRLLDDKGRALLNIHSAAGNQLSYSSVTESPFSRTIVDSAVVWYDYALAGAALHYRAFIDSLLMAWQGRLTTATTWLLANPNGFVSDTVRSKVILDSLALHNTRASVLSWSSTTAGRSRIWTRRQFDSFGYAQSFGAPPGGQLGFTFAGPATATGGVTVYKDSSLLLDIPNRKVGVWTWNLPGSAGYTAGNSHRVVNAESDRRTLFLAVNDSRYFTAMVDMFTDQPNPPSSSNPYNFPGFSISNTDQSPSEFGNFIAPTYSYDNLELPGMRLDSVPGRWGSSDITFGYHVPSLTTWHSDMEFRVVVSKVITPGTLSFIVSGMTDSSGSFTVNAPGTFKFDCHADLSTGPHRIEILPAVGQFEIDSWALHSKVLDPPTCCEGKTGNLNAVGIVDLGDLSALISYLTGGGMVLLCLDAANTNANGIVDLADLSALVSYLTGGGFALPNCP